MQNKNFTSFGIQKTINPIVILKISVFTWQILFVLIREICGKFSALYQLTLQYAVQQKKFT